MREQVHKQKFNLEQAYNSFRSLADIVSKTNIVVENLIPERENGGGNLLSDSEVQYVIIKAEKYL